VRRNKSRVKKPHCHVLSFGVLFRDVDADVYGRNAEGEMAVHIISKREDDGAQDGELFELFRENGLAPLAEDKKGRSALDVAAACEKEI
jgi:hypothetical protein